MKLIIVLLILFCLCQGKKPIKKPPKGCPKGWVMLSNINRCFYISGNFVTYENAQKSCESMNSELVPPITCEEQVDLRGLLNPHRRKCGKGRNCAEFWIGINKLTGDNWKTTKGFEINKNHRCQHWAKHFPQDNGGNCVTMSFIGNLQRGAWKNANCTKELRFACIACPSAFDYLPEIDECLILNLKPVNWSVARQTCAETQRGGQLLKIQDPIKQAAVAKYMEIQLKRNETEICYFAEWPYGERIFWMGGQTTDPEQCGTPYIWKPVGTHTIPLTFTNWFPGNPNCGYKGENCLIIMTGPNYKEYRWEDIRCQFSLCYVCEL